MFLVFPRDILINLNYKFYHSHSSLRRFDVLESIIANTINVLMYLIIVHMTGD